MPEKRLRPYLPYKSRAKRIRILKSMACVSSRTPLHCNLLLFPGTAHDGNRRDAAKMRG
jgi:hypothetical protein